MIKNKIIITNVIIHVMKVMSEQEVHSKAKGKSYKNKLINHVKKKGEKIQYWSDQSLGWVYTGVHTMTEHLWYTEWQNGVMWMTGNNEANRVSQNKAGPICQLTMRQDVYRKW